MSDEMFEKFLYYPDRLPPDAIPPTWTPPGAEEVWLTG